MNELINYQTSFQSLFLFFICNSGYQQNNYGYRPDTSDRGTSCILLIWSSPTQILGSTLHHTTSYNPVANDTKQYVFIHISLPKELLPLAHTLAHNWSWKAHQKPTKSASKENMYGFLLTDWSWHASTMAHALEAPSWSHDTPQNNPQDSRPQLLNSHRDFRWGSIVAAASYFNNISHHTSASIQSSHITKFPMVTEQARAPVFGGVISFNSLHVTYIMDMWSFDCNASFLLKGAYINITLPFKGWYIHVWWMIVWLIVKRKRNISIQDQLN